MRKSYAESILSGVDRSDGPRSERSMIALVNRGRLAPIEGGSGRDLAGRRGIAAEVIGAGHVRGAVRLDANAGSVNTRQQEARDNDRACEYVLGLPQAFLENAHRVRVAVLLNRVNQNATWERRNSACVPHTTKYPPVAVCRPDPPRNLRASGTRPRAHGRAPPSGGPMDFVVFVAFVLAGLPAIRALLRRSRGQSGGWGWPVGLWISGALILLLILAGWLLSIYTDVLWFRELGAEQRYWTELKAHWTTFLLGTLAAFAVLLVNALFVRMGDGRGPRLAKVGGGPGRGGESEGLGFRDVGDGRWVLTGGPGPGDLGRGPIDLRVPADILRLIDRLRIPALLLVAIFLGTAFESEWWTFLLYLHRQPFHQVDPQFGKDIGFYMFSLPAFNAVLSWLTGVFLLAGITTAVLYALSSAMAGFTSGSWTARIRSGARHLGILAGILFLLGAARVWLSRYELVYSQTGPLVGASAADVRMGAPLLAIYAVILVGLGITIAVLAPRLRQRHVLLFLAVWLGSGALAVGIIPAAFEALAVKPEQLRAELPYIQRHLSATREAFGLDSSLVRVSNLPDPVELTPAAMLNDAETVGNLRLADWRPLQHTYNQLQTLRTYYRFAGVDVDRYTIDGRQRAVMLSLRELDRSNVPTSGSGGWDINRWFIYTHGYGLCMNSINSFSDEGIPELLIQDLPPVSKVPGLKVTRPEIYFGELSTGPVMVKARGQQEFDYPRGDENIFTTYQGSAGIPLGNLISARRLGFALRFHTVKFFLSSYIGPETRLLMNRDISSRIRRLAPFLSVDADPYAVLRDDGSIALVRDAYTTRDRYPYGAAYHGISYIRNSVKATLDCYNGTVNFYLVDETDPLARAYRAIYPDLFAPDSAVPDDIRRHFRYPEDLIALQATVYGSFHVRDPVTFYNHEDVWEMSREAVDRAAGGTAVPVLPYYMLMRLPGESQQEFLQMIPLTPRGKDNMIAWFAGRCDPEHYGRLAAFHLPKGTISYGPRQIEARIDQDPIISKDTSLWNQQGSQVLRGNLLTVPIGGAFLYVEPLYIQSTGGKIPELKRVIVATQHDIGYGSSLREALFDLFGSEVAALAPGVEGMGREFGMEFAGTGVEGAEGAGFGAAGTEGAGGVIGNGAPGSGGSRATGEAGAAGVSGTRGAATLPSATVQSAAEHLRRYQKLMGEGRAAEAGAELDRLARDLEALSRGTGSGR